MERPAVEVHLVKGMKAHDPDGPDLVEVPYDARHAVTGQGRDTRARRRRERRTGEEATDGVGPDCPPDGRGKGGDGGGLLYPERYTDGEVCCDPDAFGRWDQRVLVQLVLRVQ